jgi:hypothetical protein
VTEGFHIDIGHTDPLFDHRAATDSAEARRDSIPHGADHRTLPGRQGKPEWRIPLPGISANNPNRIHP